MSKEEIIRLFNSLILPNENGEFPHSLQDIKNKNILFTPKVREEGIAFSFIKEYITDIPNLQISDLAKEILFTHMLTFIPFFLPSDQKNISLQMLDGDERDYTVKRFNLSPLPTSPYDAISLEPIEKENDSILLFCGTTPPPYKTFQITNIANVFPTRSIGGLLTYGHKELEDWAQKQTGLTIYGQSLGGGVALAWASKLPNVVETSIINPALPHTSIECEGEVNIYINHQDWVALIGGLAPKQSKIYRITPSILSTSTAARLALTHIQPFIASHKTTIERLDTATFNQHNCPIWWMILIYVARLVASAILIPLLLIVTVIRPIIGIFYPSHKPKPNLSPEPSQTVAENLPTTPVPSTTSAETAQDPSNDHTSRLAK